MSKSQKKTRLTVQHAIERIEELEKVAPEPRDIDMIVERLNDLNIRLNKIEAKIGMWQVKTITHINE